MRRAVAGVTVLIAVRIFEAGAEVIASSARSPSAGGLNRTRVTIIAKKAVSDRQRDAALCGVTKAYLAWAC